MILYNEIIMFLIIYNIFKLCYLSILDILSEC